MTRQTHLAVQATWDQLAPVADKAASLFYDRLFEIDPRLRTMFASTDMPAQRKKLVQALALVVSALDRVEQIVPQLESLGRRHASYGVRDEHYEVVGAALLWTLEKALADAWTADVKCAWITAYSLVAKIMRTAAADANAGHRRRAITEPAV